MLEWNSENEELERNSKTKSFNEMPNTQAKCSGEMLEPITQMKPSNKMLRWNPEIESWFQQIAISIQLNKNSKS